MFADWIKCTHNGTGGSSTLTLVAQTGFPGPSDIWGAAGSVMVYYTIDEYTDSTKAALKQAETGLGSLNLSTGVLTRSVPWRTWVSGSGFVASSASAISFGATAANIDILLTANASMLAPPVPAINAISDGWLPIDATAQVDTGFVHGYDPIAGTRYYAPIRLGYGKPITSIGVYTTSANPVGGIRIGLYDWGSNGLANHLLYEFLDSSGAPLQLAAASGYQSFTPANVPFVPPGWYWLCVQPQAAATLYQIVSYCNDNCGHSAYSGRKFVNYFKAATYPTATGTQLPSVADSTSLTLSLQSNGNTYAVFIK